VCIAIPGSGACGTFAKICNNRATCPMTLSGAGTCGASSKCTSAAANIKTAPLATASHAMVLEYADAPRDLCATEGFRDRYGKVAADYVKDARAHLVKDLGRTKAAQITTVKFVPQLCSPIFNAGKPTSRHGIGGYVTVTGPPDLVDDALQALDRDDMPYPASTKTVCGAGCRRTAAKLPVSYGGAAASALAGDAGGSDPLIVTLQAYIGNGFDVRKFNPYGNFQESVPVTFNPSTWTKDKVFDIASMIAFCAANEGTCFQLGPLGSFGCPDSPSTKFYISSAQRQNDIAAAAKVDAKYVGVAGSGSNSFISAQSTIEGANVLPTAISAECAVHTFWMPVGVVDIKFSSIFVQDIGSVLDAISRAKGMDDKAEAANLLGRALRLVLDKYGTHVPTAFSYTAVMRLEMLLRLEDRQKYYLWGSSWALELELMNAVAELQKKGASTDPGTTAEFLQLASARTFTLVPGTSTIPLKPGEPQPPTTHPNTGAPIWTPLGTKCAHVVAVIRRFRGPFRIAPTPDALPTPSSRQKTNNTQTIRSVRILRSRPGGVEAPALDGPSRRRDTVPHTHSESADLVAFRPVRPGQFSMDIVWATLCQGGS